MSVKLMSQVWECALDHAEQSILLAMADHAHDDGTHVYPSILRIAWKTDYSDRQVKRVGQKLRAKGALVLVAKATKGHPAEYRIDLSVLPPKQSWEDFYRDKMSPQNKDAVEGTLTNFEGTLPAESGDIVMAPKPSEEPLIKDQPSINTSRSRAPTRKKKTRKDERRTHSAIIQLYQVIGRQPKTIFLDDIISMADPDHTGHSHFDVQKLKDLVRIADSVGCQPDNILVWLLPTEGWYVAGVPLRWRGRPIEIALAQKYRSNGPSNGTNPSKPAQFWRPINWRELGLKLGDPKYKWKAEELQNANS